MKAFNARRRGRSPRSQALLAGALAMMSTVLLTGNTVASAAGVTRIPYQHERAGASPSSVMVDGVSIPEDPGSGRHRPGSCEEDGSARHHLQRLRPRRVREQWQARRLGS